MPLALVSSGAAGHIDLHLVLERLLPFLSAHQILDPSSTLTVAEINEFFHLSFVFRCEYPGLLHQDFSIVSVGISPLQILIGRFFHVHLHVLQGMLFDVPNPEVGVFFNPAHLRDSFTGEEFDERRLARTVSADDGGARREGERAGHILERRLGSPGIGV